MRLASRFGSVVALAPLLSLGTLGCSGGGDSGGPNAAKLAGDLVQCKNDQLDLKNQIDHLKLENAQLKKAADATVHLDPTDLKAGAPPAAQHHEGNLPPEKVLAVLRARSGGLRACYERGLKRNPSLQYVQSVSVRFSVKSTGKAIDVSFKPHSDGEMEQCMAQAIGGWSFPTFSGDPVQFEAPVNLVAK